MTTNRYEIKDRCRKNLNAYTLKAFSCIPVIDNPVVLDMGCGTGVPTIALMENCNGIFYAVDSDASSLQWFKEKVTALNYTDRIQIIHASAYDSDLFSEQFDIIVAEGLLNVIGFEKGLSILLNYLKNDGYVLLHDELKNDTEKKELFKKYNLQVLTSFELNEEVWWNEYFSCLEKEISALENDSLCEDEKNEILHYKKNPALCRSIYYVLQNGV